MVRQTPTEITNVEDMEAAAAHLSELAAVASDLEKERKAEGQPHRDKVNGINAAYKPVSEGVATAIAAIKGIVGDWRREQERIKAEAEALAARIEAQRLAKIREEEFAEARRLEKIREDERKAAQEQRELEALQKAEETGDDSALEPGAIEAAVQEDMRVAEESRPIVPAPPPPPKVTPRPRVEAYTPTLNTRKVYRHEITEPDLLPKRWYKIDTAKIAAEVKANGMLTNIPGVTVWEDEDIITKKAQ